jgi:RNA polymerase sigma factor (sigma-70 family)
MDDDTDLGGPVVAFPSTRASLIHAVGSDDRAIRQQAEQDLIAAYWKPVYKYIRCKWEVPNEDAKDLTQAFFARAVEKSFLSGFEPAKARFRTFIRVCVDGFVANEQRAAGRLKRGGVARVLALDFDTAEGELRRHAPAAAVDPDEYFRQEWVRGLFALAVEDLRLQCAASGKTAHFALFERYDLDGPDGPERLTYGQLAQEFGLPVTQVTNHLAAVRRQFRRLVLERLRASTSSDDEYQDEVRRLFGGDVG